MCIVHSMRSFGSNSIYNLVVSDGNWQMDAKIKLIDKKMKHEMQLRRRWDIHVVGIFSKS